MKSRIALALLALGLTLSTPAAFAQEKSGGSLAGIFAFLFDFLDAGSALDPSGDDTDNRGGWDPNGLTAGDDGRGIDPNGFASAGKDDGIGIDPHGGRGGGAGRDEGVAIDPFGRGGTIDPNG